MLIDPQLQAMVDVADADWLPVLARGLQAVAAAQPDYLPQLLSGPFLPNGGRLLARPPPAASS